MMVEKLFDFKLAPPTSAPSMSAILNNAEAFSGVQLPPYKTLIVLALL
jgi:hypothetical protein